MRASPEGNPIVMLFFLTSKDSLVFTDETVNLIKSDFEIKDLRNVLLTVAEALKCKCLISYRTLKHTLTSRLRLPVSKRIIIHYSDILTGVPHFTNSAITTNIY